MTTVAAVEGLGPTFADRLRQAGVETVDDLLREGGRRSGRIRIATITGIDESRILEWVNRADLMRIKGVGSEYSDLLEAAGVEGVRELARRNPANLSAQLNEVNETKKLVRRTPPLAEVVSWVAQAGQLTPAIDEGPLSEALRAELADYYRSAPEESDADRIAKILALEGSISDEDAERMLARVRELRENWR